jgi:SsrA-binding protein
LVRDSTIRQLLADTRKVDIISAMAKSGKKKKKGPVDPNERVISENRRAKHDYHVLESLECGIVLVGSEVKSLRAGTASLSEAYGRVRNGEVWLVGCDIPEYIEANQFNHKPKRDRKLLLHQREISPRALYFWHSTIALALSPKEEGILGKYSNFRIALETLIG